MDAVGDRIDVVAGKHQPRHLAMLLCHAVDVMAQIERQERHVQHIAAAKYIFHFFDFLSAEHLMHQRHRKLIVSGGHRRVRREDTFFAHRLNVVAIRRCLPGRAGFLIQELQREQTRVAFVHVITLDLAMTEARNMRTPPMPRMTSWHSR